MIDIPYGTRKLNDLYELFKLDKDNKTVLQANSKPIARFRACDHIDFNNTESQRNGTTAFTIDHLTIKTTAMLDFTKGDVIKSVKDGKLWRLNDFTIMDDNDMKEFSARPRKWTILTLTSRGA